MNLLLGYVVIVGTVTAGAKIARGAVEAINKVTQGKHGEGLWKLAGGLVTPAKDAGSELWSLGTETVAAAQLLRGKVKGWMGRTQISNSAGEAKA
jgi:hypothetical protein